jgi:adenylylsulfate kinase-like enzyme
MPQKNVITITVAGLTGSGKSTVARLIRNALQFAGFEIVLEDEGDEVPSASLISRTEGIIDHGTKLVVRTTQLPRVGHA